jgi:hypothetical protein
MPGFHFQNRCSSSKKICCKINNTKGLPVAVKGAGKGSPMIFSPATGSGDRYLFLAFIVPINYYIHHAEMFGF